MFQKMRRTSTHAVQCATLIAPYKILAPSFPLKPCGNDAVRDFAGEIWHNGWTNTSLIVTRFGFYPRVTSTSPQNSPATYSICTVWPFGNKHSQWLCSQYPITAQTLPPTAQIKKSDCAFVLLFRPIYLCPPRQRPIHSPLYGFWVHMLFEHPLRW